MHSPNISCNELVVIKTFQIWFSFLPASLTTGQGIWLSLNFKEKGL